MLTLLTVLQIGCIVIVVIALIMVILQISSKVIILYRLNKLQKNLIRKLKYYKKIFKI